MPKQHINPDTLMKMPSYSQVVVASGSRTVYVAGQGAFDNQMRLVGEGDYYAQTVKAFQNLVTALEAGGAKLSDVVSSVMYVKHLTPEALEQFSRATSVALGGKAFPPNASTMVGVQALGHPDMLVEISAVAVID
ncbi:RidA family protein [Denitratisoma oestradiolicum]|uniref:RidA family protein n=1 Tax=Denitratisoma oestradiolicum TaxID=311182 RepID=A0A6S6XVM2_9PROT|nr:RidA family protein [Denitratisoma oestradiolicum]TWO80149.1 enamine deaminase RidA [Denitratisoma oestradiolicum]CAB1370009.1 RidA family protein [Denitratisoma oestradiolicum]